MNMQWADFHWAATLFLISEWIIRVVMLVMVPIRRSPASANSWLALIFFEPWIGLILYAIIGRATLPRSRRKILDSIPSLMEKRIREIRDRSDVFYPEVPAELKQAVHLAYKLGRMPILAGNNAELLVDYDDVIDRMIDDIDKATQHVHLLFYIFADDETGNRVLDALAKAVQRGIACRVIVDGLGSRRPMRTMIPKMKAAGVEVVIALPVRFLRFWRSRVDLRNHRKIAVIDGNIGYTGSQNIVNAILRPGIHYEELMVRVTGPVVLELQWVFISDWSVEHGEVLSDEALFPDPVKAGETPAQVLPSGPEYETDDYEPQLKEQRYRQAAERNQRLIVALLHGARKRVVMTTPYFIPDEPLLQAIQTAVLRGVEVRLVVSKQEDQFLVGQAQKSYYGQLLDLGVKIHLYHEKFLHAKHISFDDDIVLIGSSNFDIRSFALNAEISILFYDETVAAELRKHQERYFDGSVILRAEIWRRRSIYSKISQRLARLMSPLL